jgi:peptide deformylase
MKPLEIRKFPDRVLREKCPPIVEISEREKRLFAKMLFTMKYYNGIGLAAPQIGIIDRLIVACIEEEPIMLANPEILAAKGCDIMSEGCLSIPDVSVEVERSFEIIAKGLNGKGELVELKVSGLLARVLQHEIDHLNGRLIIDYPGFSPK